ncbi:MAG: hypothetical protein SWC40_11460 [Thermodesulfobacteriota bacterium]|nr:hypothetical protein [Thermodesulfobacteriota bacterium]
MRIEFRRQEKIARCLDPRKGFAESQVRTEIRWDPLTGESALVGHFVGFKLEPVDFTRQIEESRPNCPFCPERVLDHTPKFPTDLVPGGRVERGEAVVFPNLSPYGEHSAVAVMCREHFIAPSGFTPSMLSDAFLACIDYFDHITHRPGTDFAIVSWNYMPAAGSSQVHPHLQAYASDVPGSLLAAELAASRRYCEAEGRPYWTDLIEEEERRGERLVARGRYTAWLTAFVSLSPLADIMVIFPEVGTMKELSKEALEEFSRGLCQCLGHLGSLGIYSFSLGWFPARKEGDNHFRLHVRLSPRLYVAPRVWCTDTPTFSYLYREPFMFRTPEELARGLRSVIRLC